jgi:endonuclease-3
MKKSERYKRLIDYFSKHMPVAESELDFRNTYELIVAVILSAQCTDKRVNMTTPAFYKNFPTVEVLANSSVEEVFSYIKSVTFPYSKAEHLVGMAKMLVSDYKGLVPSEVDDLLKLPGVGRKTANVVASVAFNKPVMAVDTHVFRVTARIGLSVNAANPHETEKQLVKNFPKDKIAIAHHWLILHGRYVCVARKPKCHECGLTEICMYFNKAKK